MKKKTFYILASMFFLFLITAFAHADYVTLTWHQSRGDTDLKGWKIFYGVYEENLPEPPLSAENYDVVIDLVAFDEAIAPQNPFPQINLPQGMKVYPWPDGPSEFWIVTYNFYMPPLPVNGNQEYYLAVICYDLEENKSEWSNIVDFSINPPGQVGAPVINVDIR